MIMTEKMLSRRHFLHRRRCRRRPAGAVAPAFAASTSASGMPAKWDMETDVVVLGCGGAGMMTACQVVDAGKEGRVFDAGLSPFHTATNLCGGLFTAYGSDAPEGRPPSRTAGRPLQKTSWPTATT